MKKKGGASFSDLNATGYQNFVGAVTSTAVKNLQAATVNQLSSSYFSGASSTQLAAFISSPYYSGFSDSIKSTISTASGATTTSSTTSDSGQIGYSLAYLILSAIVALVCLKIN